MKRANVKITIFFIEFLLFVRLSQIQTVQPFCVFNIAILLTNVYSIIVNVCFCTAFIENFEIFAVKNGVRAILKVSEMIFLKKF